MQFPILSCIHSWGWIS